MALTLSFIVKSFLVQAFFIPSESMQDTLLVGDRVVVSKLTPGPFDLERGDIVVFEDPGDWLSPTPEASRGPVLDGVRDALMFVGLLPDTSEGHLIKRVIGLPGDRVQCGTGAKGSVPLDLVVGKAVVTVWPFDRMSGLSGHDEVFTNVRAPGTHSLAPPGREPHTS